VDDLTPQQIVAELNRYIVGQAAAKRSVAVALRNRYRRRKLPDDIREEVLPKNIIMIGPTGVGKTEIARRLSRLANAPFIKVEVTKFSEVGYVGRDVDSIIRDLTEESVRLVKEEMQEELSEKIDLMVEEQILALLLPGTELAADDGAEAGISRSTRDKWREYLRSGKVEDRTVEISSEVSDTPMVEVFSNAGMEEMGFNFKSMFGNLFPRRTRRKTMTIKEARPILRQQAAQELVDMDEVVKEALHRVESNGIVFLDEIDKVTGGDERMGPHVSRQGVQRDLLPLVEGATVMSKYGSVRTHHVLFIAAGAFHGSSPSDLIPELQGRFPIRVELDSLSRDDFQSILSQPKNALTKQYTALMATEEVDLRFTEDGVAAVADYAFSANERHENIGARRLFTIMEKVLEDVAFLAPEDVASTVVVNQVFVDEHVGQLFKDRDLSRYIL
jgi:ATP-dependent HslUV protease ATP-binding subunit HslU